MSWNKMTWVFIQCALDLTDVEATSTAPNAICCGLLCIGKSKCRLEAHFANHLSCVCNGHLELVVAHHFNSPPYSHPNLTVFNLLHSQSEAKHKLEEQHLIYRLIILQPNSINNVFSNLPLNGLLCSFHILIHPGPLSWPFISSPPPFSICLLFTHSTHSVVDPGKATHKAIQLWIQHRQEKGNNSPNEH